jgi:tripartite-type tricarboxylate transporter receptor subunit TctC
VTSAKRVNLIPEVPTVAESGLPGYEIVGWFGLFAPAGTQAPIIGRLEKEVNAALQLPDVQKRFGSQGLLPGGGTSAELGKFLRAEIARWGTLIKDIGLEAQ